MKAVGADAVADEVGPIFAVDDALAQPLVPKSPIYDISSGSVSGPGDEFQQLHEAHRVEEVGNQEVAAEVFARPVERAGARGRPDVLELMIVPGRRTASIRA